MVLGLEISNEFGTKALMTVENQNSLSEWAFNI